MPVLSRAEQNYIIEKELLALYGCLNIFDHIYTKFTIVTDHKYLVWLFNITDPRSRLMQCGG